MFNLLVYEESESSWVHRATTAVQYPNSNLGRGLVSWARSGFVDKHGSHGAAVRKFWTRTLAKHSCFIHSPDTSFSQLRLRTLCGNNFQLQQSFVEDAFKTWWCSKAVTLRTSNNKIPTSRQTSPVIWLLVAMLYFTATPIFHSTATGLIFKQQW